MLFNIYFLLFFSLIELMSDRANKRAMLKSASVQTLQEVTINCDSILTLRKLHTSPLKTQSLCLNLSFSLFLTLSPFIWITGWSLALFMPGWRNDNQPINLQVLPLLWLYDYEKKGSPCKTINNTLSILYASHCDFLCLIGDNTNIY